METGVSQHAMFSRWKASPFREDSRTADFVLHHVSAAPVEDLDVVVHLEVSAQERGGPDRGMIAEVTRIRVAHRGDQRIDSTLTRPRAAGSWGVPEARPQVESFALLESLDPVVDRLATHAEEVGDIF